MDQTSADDSDDGPGFDPSSAPDDGKPHVGIANVRERLVDTCGGTLDIRSEPGKGTTAINQLPKAVSVRDSQTK